MAETVKIKFVADTAELEASLKKTTDKIKQDLSQSVQEATKPQATELPGLDAKTAEFKEKLKRKIVEAATESAQAGGKALTDEMKKQIEANADRIAAKVESIVGALGVAGAAFAGVVVAFGAINAIVKSAESLVLETDKANRNFIDFAAIGKTAGLTFDVISDAASQAARNLQLTNNEAIAFTKSLIAFRTAAGSDKDVNAITQAVGNLAAVKGIRPEALPALSQQLSQGVTSAFESIGITDLDARYQAFARSIKTTADNLTEQEKAQIRLNALMEAGGQLAGAAAAANDTLAGAYGRLNRATSQVSENLAEIVNFSPLLRDLTLTIAQVAESVSDFNKDRIIAGLKQGKTTQQIATESVDAGTFLPGGVRLTDVVRSLVSAPFALSLAPLLGTDFLNQAANPFAIKDRDVESVRQMVDAYKRLLEASEKQAETEKKANENRDKAIEAERERVRLAREFQQSISRELRTPEGISATEAKSLKRFLPEGLFNASGGQNPFEVLSRIPSNLATSLDTLRSVRAKIADSPLFKEPEKIQQLFDIDRTIEQSISAAKQKVDSVIQSARTATLDIFAQVNTQNPFVRVYTDAEKAIERTRDATRGLSAEIREQLLTTTRAGEAFKLFTARVDSRLESLSLRQQAQDFRRPFDANATRQQELQYLQRFLAANPNFLFLNNLTSLDINSPIAQNLLNRARDAGIIDDPTARTRRRIDDQINLLRSLRTTSGQEAELIDSRLIGLSRGVDPLTLRADQRQVIAEALERQAERVERREQEAINIMQQQLAVQKAISETQARLLQVAESQGQRGIEAIIRLQNETDNTARASLKAPSIRDTQEVFAGSIGLLSTSSGLTNR